VAVGALAGFTATAGAAADAIPTKIVRYADLDLTKPAGAKVLYQRIEAAAHEVCESASTHDLASLSRSHYCIEQAIDEAVRKVDSTALSELRFGSSPRLARQ
jgi:UrcA family protein